MPWYDRRVPLFFRGSSLEEVYVVLHTNAEFERENNSATGKIKIIPRSIYIYIFFFFHPTY